MFSKLEIEGAMKLVNFQFGGYFKWPAKFTWHRIYKQFSLVQNRLNKFYLPVIVSELQHQKLGFLEVLKFAPLLLRVDKPSYTSSISVAACRLKYSPLSKEHSVRCTIIRRFFSPIWCYFVFNLFLIEFLQLAFS